ncbi:OsmC family protein [Amorphus orientalis]|uniref:OsmC-like protein n=1 Tax=Amorphus orientalis TaxID=649198 RepID=A0AAE3VLL9_9HYPH|nr:OsmC family protein [Amorphus orientalis]MDQ0314326.1 putative OsmC-like protein [Amorphus orientalis]
MSSSQMFEVVFDAEGVAVGKMRNEITLTARTPFTSVNRLATDEGAFQGGEGTAPTPLEYFLTGLVGCLMTQIRVFARKLKVDVSDLKVTCRAEWAADRGEIGPYETRPKGFHLDVDLASDAPPDDVARLIEAAKRGCFVEQTLAVPNTVSHRFRINSGEWRDA